MESGRLRIQFQRFGANFADRWLRWTGARLIEVHLHSNSFGGTLKWPLKGGSRLIEVTATAGLTVRYGSRKDIKCLLDCVDEKKPSCEFVAFPFVSWVRCGT